LLASDLFTDELIKKTENINETFKLAEDKQRDYKEIKDEMMDDEDLSISFKRFSIIFWPEQDFYAKIPPFASDEPLDVQLLCHYQENRYSGQRFLRVAVRQLIEDKDDDKVIEQNQEDDQQDDQEKKYIDITSIKLYLFDEITRQFELQYESLYDVSDGLLDHES
jgi:inorganic pyrophosphatase